MCGIAGILYADEVRPTPPERLRAMADAIAHRGPDAAGYWTAPGIGLAHRRLSIIDLAGGDQPIGNEDGSVQVVFNGEIYNYRELRQELAGHGHQFRTQSDTEVLVHLYEECGAQLVDRLRGMFAFALWDTRQRTLLLARDRVGLKPLYIYRDREKLLFASELKGILAHGEVDRSLDLAALEDYLAFGYIPGERSIFSRVMKLPPGHTMLVKAGSLQQASPQQYWRYEPRVDSSRSTADWLAAIDAKIDETVAVHEIADVPVGAFLSGGLDSSAIVAAHSRRSSEPLQTFSIGFEDSRRSELPYARQVARQFGCLHTERLVTPAAATALDDLVHYYDEPFADSSAIPSLLLARVAREQVKVALSGDGGDEAFGGYRRYAHDLGEARWRNRLPGWLREGIVANLARIWPKADWLPRPLRAKTLLTNLSLPANRAYANTLSICRPPRRRGLLSGDVVAQLNGNDPGEIICRGFDAAPPSDTLAGMIAADVSVVLPDDFLTKVDRASMACGLEVRPPLVDHELLELTGQMPSELKIRDGRTKWLLHELYRDRLPPDITSRPKQGFELPTDDWLRGPLRDVFEATLFDGAAAIAPLIDERAVRRLQSEHQARIGAHGSTLWSLLVLARWAEEYLHAEQPQPVSVA